MRGKASRGGLILKDDGITPAYAGKRLMVTSHSARTWDHPRVCGEKFVVVGAHEVNSGSPPRMRGKGALCILGKGTGGITPAYAGKRKKLPPCELVFGDHPRVCGEKRQHKR